MKYRQLGVVLKLLGDTLWVLDIQEELRIGRWHGKFLEVALVQHCGHDSKFPLFSPSNIIIRETGDARIALLFTKTYGKSDAVEARIDRNEHDRRGIDAGSMQDRRLLEALTMGTWI